MGFDSRRMTKLYWSIQSDNAPLIFTLVRSVSPSLALSAPTSFPPLYGERTHHIHLNSFSGMLSNHRLRRRASIYCPVAMATYWANDDLFVFSLIFSSLISTLCAPALHDNNNPLVAISRPLPPLSIRPPLRRTLRLCRACHHNREY